MDFSDIDLTGVNWQHGMLLTPEHFQRQERSIESLVLWMVRYLSPVHGLAGAGPRVAPSERGAARHDPVWDLQDEGDHLRISVTQCRGLTPGGGVIDVNPQYPVHGDFSRASLEGVQDTKVYLLQKPHEKHPVNGPEDEWNAQILTAKTPTYVLTLQPLASEAAHALALGRIRRQGFATRFVKDDSFIPACISMASHSELFHSGRQISARLADLAGRYTALHRGMQEFISLSRERGLETDMDVESLRFVGRTVEALQSALYDIADPVQPPQRFFTLLRRFVHSTAVYLDLSPPVRAYFEQIRDLGESELVTHLARQRKHVEEMPSVELSDDLRKEVQASLEALESLRRLEQMMEGKYVDFRICPSLDAMNFFFEFAGRSLYRLQGKCSHTQGEEDTRILTFSNLKLEGKENYRLVIVTEPGTSLGLGAEIPAEIHINQSTGFRREPLFQRAVCELDDQLNYAFDFQVPDVPSVTDLQAFVPAFVPVRTALLYTRQRFTKVSQGFTQPAAAETPAAPPPPQQPPQYSGGAGAPQYSGGAQPPYSPPGTFGQPDPGRGGFPPQRPGPMQRPPAAPPPPQAPPPQADPTRSRMGGPGPQFPPGARPGPFQGPPPAPPKPGRLAPNEPPPDPRIIKKRRIE